MGKLLLWVVVIGAGWFGWAMVRNWQRKSDRAAQAPKPSQTVEPEQIVSCSHCGVHLPASEAIDAPGGPFCSAAHRDAAGN